MALHQSFLKSIYEDGLSRMTRNHIHFSHDLETAINVGSRKDKKPIILHVSALEMHNDGIKFYKSKKRSLANWSYSLKIY